MLCSLARWQLSAALDRRGERPRLCAAHLGRCESCQAFARKLEVLHGRLAATAAGAPRPALVPRRRWMAPAVATGVLAVAAGAALYLLSPGQPARDVEPVAVAPEATPRVQDDVAEPAAPETSGGSAGGSIALSDEPEGAQAPRGRDALERLSVLFTAPPRLRAEIDALASDGRRGALAILSLGGVIPDDQRVR
jgi:hypothetical protein